MSLVDVPEDGTLSLDQEFKTFLKAFQMEAALTKRDIQEYENTSLDDIKAVIVAIQRKHLSNKKQLYMRRLEVFLVNMEAYGKVIEVFLNSSDYLAFVWVSILFGSLLLELLSLVSNGRLLLTASQLGPDEIHVDGKILHDKLDGIRRY